MRWHVRLILGLAAIGACPSTAFGGVVHVRRAAFTDAVRDSLPVGGSPMLGRGAIATYWLEVDNGGAPTYVTVVWRLDGRVAQRQVLPVGHSPHWRTWARQRLAAARRVEVDVLDESGATIRHERLRVVGAR